MDVFSADWLGICRRSVAVQRRIFEEVRGIEERTVYDGVGEGGDHSLVIDRRCEEAVFDELEKLAAEGAAFVAVSEERGEVAFGEGGALLGEHLELVEDRLLAAAVDDQTMVAALADAVVDGALLDPTHRREDLLLRSHRAATNSQPVCGKNVHRRDSTAR